MKLVILALLTTLILGAFQQASAGGRDGGGGTGVRINGQMILLDLFVNSPNFKDTYKDPALPLLRTQMGPNGMAKLRSEYSVHLDRTGQDGRTWLDVGVGGYRFDLLRQRLYTWERSSPLLIGAVITTIDQTEYRLYLRTLPEIKDFYLPGPLRSRVQDITTVAYYSAGLSLHTYLSPLAFTELGDLSFGALILHEALRKMKIKDGVEVSEQTLQEVTAKVMLTNPLPGETLDSEKTLGIKLASLEESARPHIVLCKAVQQGYKETQLLELRQLHVKHCSPQSLARFAGPHKNIVSLRADLVEKLTLGLQQIPQPRTQSLAPPALASYQGLLTLSDHLSNIAMAGWSRGYTHQRAHLGIYLP